MFVNIWWVKIVFVILLCVGMTPALVVGQEPN